MFGFNRRKKKQERESVLVELKKGLEEARKLLPEENSVPTFEQDWCRARLVNIQLRGLAGLHKIAPEELGTSEMELTDLATPRSAELA